MAYKALYRKYRPKNFNEVAGQDTIVQILKNSIMIDKISHAYLFYGPRGTGKTSVAKIFAKTVNCDDCMDGIACGKCNKCMQNDMGNSVDIIEIDAASNNGVDEIRELKSKINLVPSVMKYKVYIIDEVHMLSIGAFNALLKTLEEPPNHVIFILATTELHKVPNTIISRCQLLEFRKISEQDMLSALKNVARIENINIDDDAILEIVKYSDGGMRDALGLLDKLSLYSNDLIDVSKVRNVCGNASLEDVNSLYSYIKNCDRNGIVEKIDELYLKGTDLINVTNDLVLCFKNDLNEDSSNSICLLLLGLIDTIDKMKKSVNPRIVLIASILSMIDDDTQENISREIYSLEKDEDEIEKKSIKDIADDKKVDVNNDKVITETKDAFDYEKFKLIRVNNTFARANKNLLQKIKFKWNDLASYTFDRENGRLASLLMDSIPVVCSDSYIVLVVKYDSLSFNLNTNYLKVEEFILKLLGESFKIVCLTAEEWNEKKKEYISNLKEKKNYSLMNEEFNNNDSDIDEGEKITEFTDDLTIKSKELFGNNNVIIK